jgi:hypothetical protein
MKKKANNIGEFIQCLEEIGEPDIFRGQTNRNWEVLPSLARKHPELNNSKWAVSSWLELEDLILQDFIRQAVPFMDFKPENHIEWLVHAQHHGLPTVLLDWTTNALKALFFAVENPFHDDFDGAVYSYTPAEWYQSSENIRNTNETICFYTKHINNRIIAQEACFIHFFIPEGTEPFEPLRVNDEDDQFDDGWLDEIIIPKESKQLFRMKLMKLGITHQSIFPGLDGIATSIRRNMGWV